MIYNHLNIWSMLFILSNICVYYQIQKTKILPWVSLVDLLYSSQQKINSLEINRWKLSLLCYFKDLSGNIHTNNTQVYLTRDDFSVRTDPGLVKGETSMRIKEKITHFHFHFHSDRTWSVPAWICSFII